MSNWNTLICPYCQKEMKGGNIKGDGRKGLKWIEEGRKSSVFTKSHDEVCVILSKPSLFNNLQVDACYCDNCKKIVINLL